MVVFGTLMYSNDGCWSFVHMCTKHVLKSRLFQLTACQTPPKFAVKMRAPYQHIITYNTTHTTAHYATSTIIYTSQQRVEPHQNVETQPKPSIDEIKTPVKERCAVQADKMKSLS